ncbi:hypothetical protein [Paenibacillus sp. NEAU-GSW1]|uniref:hypothetical protein n=1 Tax=Paenibacillus sp. NEAU-GSW1 TaxID=2682486 RepID=UPI0012E299D5|nr:hypothetical protein [Paenibacillus sp. NEAU-GSW1]MUT65306.1 hypothetical protein [Paenibacillus sp. NEAU-GSW1]
MQGENDDWIDPEVLERFNDLAGNVTGKSLVMAPLGQDCLIAYLNEQQRREINRFVKHKFESQAGS